MSWTLSWGEAEDSLHNLKDWSIILKKTFIWFTVSIELCKYKSVIFNAFLCSLWMLRALSHKYGKNATEGLHEEKIWYFLSVMEGL